MAYPFEIYAPLSIVDLERRLKNLQPLVRTNIRAYNEIKCAMQNQEYGEALLREYKETLDDLKLDMERIIMVIELKRGGG